MECLIGCSYSSFTNGPVSENEKFAVINGDNVGALDTKYFEDTDGNTLKWALSHLFSGGLRMSEGGLSAINEFIASIKLPIAKDYDWWGALCLNFADSKLNSHFILDEYFLDSIRKGIDPGRILDEYLIHHTGSYILKVGEGAFSVARRAILSSLIQHTGCAPICKFELSLLLKSKKCLSDRPSPMLIELWRACNRILEHYVRMRQVSGATYDACAKTVIERAEFLCKINPPPEAMSLEKTWNTSAIFDKEHHLSEEMARILSNMLDYFTSSTCNVDEIMLFVSQAAIRGAMRVAGFKTFALLFQFTSLPECSEESGLPISSLPLQSAVISRIASSLLRLPLRFNWTANTNAAAWNTCHCGHYMDGLEGIPVELSTTVKSSFESVFEFITQFILRSTWAGDRDSQLVGLASWALRILPADHAFLNKVNIFRVLQTVLDDSRNTMIRNQSSTSSELDFSQFCAMADKRLSRLSLIVVHSLASQVATCSEQGVGKDPNLALRSPLTKVLSGPDTLSLSLFDMLYTELFIGLKQLIASAVMPSDLLEDLTSEPPMNHRDTEKYMYRILNLLFSVSSSPHCLRAMTSPKWITLLLDTIGCGGLSLQRKLLQILLPIIVSTDPQSFIALIGGLYGSREEIIYSSAILGDVEIESLIDTASYSRESIPERLFCLLFEGINVLTPLLDAEGVHKYQQVMEHIETNRTAECISFYCLLIFRSLAADSKWRRSIYRFLLPHISESIRWDEANRLLSTTAAFCALGGYCGRIWEGARVNVSVSRLMKDSDVYPSRLLTSSFCPAYLLCRSGAFVEIAVDSNGNAAANSMLGPQSCDIPFIRVLRLSASDIKPINDTSWRTIGTLASELRENIFAFLSDVCLPFLNFQSKENTVQRPQGFLTEDLQCRQYLAAVTALKAVSDFSIDAVGELLSKKDAIDSLLSVASQNSTLGGFQSLEYIEERWTSILDHYFLKKKAKTLPSREKSPRPPEHATSTNDDNSSRSEPHPLANRLGVSGQLSPAGLLSALGMGGLGVMSNTSREADPQAVEQMMEMGIAKEWAEFALRRCRNNIEIAINMCFEHGAEMSQLVAEDAIIQQAQSQRTGSVSRRPGARESETEDRRLEGLAPSIAQYLNHSVRRTVSSNDVPSTLRPLTDLGFPLNWCLRAMEASGNNIDSALGWILANGERLMTFDSEHFRSNQDISNTSCLPLSVIGGNAIISENCMCRGSSSGFPTVGCRGYAAKHGKWYYECTVITAGCCQIGWADVSFEGAAADGKGVGDDGLSWAFDGYRSMLWHGYSENWGIKWKANDIVCCAVDLDAGIMRFYLNGLGEEVGMGIAFTCISISGGLYPAASFNRGGMYKF